MESSVVNYFESILKNLNCENDTKNYIIGVFSKPIDLSQDSITKLFIKAREEQNFVLYQKIGDWIIFYNALNCLKHSFKDYYDDIGRLSYYSCYKLINKKWKLYQELADNLIQLESEIANNLSDQMMVLTSSQGIFIK
jgi:hypothetical protein